MEKNKETGLAVFIALFFMLIFFLPQTPIMEEISALGSRSQAESIELNIFRSGQHNFSFSYPAGFDGYNIIEDEPISNEDALIFITPNSGRQLLLQNNQSFISIRIYRNIGEDIDTWATNNPEIRYDEKINGHQKGRLNNREAIWFQTRDTIGSDNMIIKNNNTMIVITSFYPLFSQSIRDDLMIILETINFND